MLHLSFPFERAGRRYLAMPLAALAAVSSASAYSSNEPFSAIPGSFRHPEVIGSALAPVADAELVHFAVSLEPRDLVGLQNFVESVSDPKSSSFRQFIPPEEVGRRFGPSQADLDATVAFLKSNGLSIAMVSKNRMAIIVDGSAKQVSGAFKTSLAYAMRIGLDGMPQSYRTNLSALQMPTSLASKVISIDGVDTTIIHTRKEILTTQLTPSSFRNSYNDASLYQGGFYGQGVNLAIANWDGYRLDNIPYWTTANNLPVPMGGAGSNITVTPVGPTPTIGVTYPNAEGDLDLEAALMAAPLANIFDYDDSQSDTGYPITTLAQIASDNVADIVSESYGWLTSLNQTYLGPTYVAAHNQHLSMSAQGITYLAATGDNGPDLFPNSGYRVGYPDIDPDVLMVGGTVETVGSTTGNRVREVPWGFVGGVGGTGGFDPFDSQLVGFPFNVAPSYQLAHLKKQTRAYNYRLLPDIAAFAGGRDGLGTNKGKYWALSIFYNDDGQNYPVGSSIVIDGTSIASPATAGGLAAVMSSYFHGVTPNSSRSNVRFGRLQDYLYAAGENPQIFHDITTGTGVGYLPGTSVEASPTVGWDFATGWGTLNFAGFLQYIINGGQTP